MATIVMSADKVIEAATRVIEGIRAERTKRDEELLARLMTPRKLFGFTFKAPTREKVISHLMANSWSYPSNYAWGALSHAKKLLVLAKHGDPVTLNEEDARVLF